jgi:phosphate-selective porin OprO/OprP
LGCIALLVVAPAVRAQEKRVVDQLLEILRQNKQISDQQYRELKQKAEEERQQDLHKAIVAPVPPPPAAPAVPPAPAAIIASPPAPAPSPDTMRAYFKNGFNLESADGNFKFQAGAFTQLDWAIVDPSQQVTNFFNTPPNSVPGLKGISTGVEFRRARIYLAGLVYGNIDWKFEYDFAEQTGGQPSFKDVYMGMSQIPAVQYVRLGHFKEPFSLEELTPDTYTTFQERALPNAFAQPNTNFPLSGSNSTVSGTDRNTGIAAYQTFFNQHMTLATGGFILTDNFGNGFGTGSPYDINVRATGVPLYDAGQDLLHIGFSYAHKFRNYSSDSQQTIEFASRPEAHLYPTNLVNTGFIPTNGADIFDPELAYVYGPLALQGEYMWALVDQSNLSCTTVMGKITCTNAHHSNPQFGGGYIEASYFLTGESRASFYRTQFGHFERVIPNESFTIDGQHWGAVQIAARYSYLNLDSASIHGGALDDITGGVNWFLNPVTRITVNYVWAHRESVGDSNIVEGRFQLSF